MLARRLVASCKFQRTVALPVPRTTSAKYFSDNSGDDDEDAKNYDEINPLCQCCTCPGGCKSDVSHYDIRKYGHCLHQNTRCPDFPTLYNIPTDVFRCTTGERLGPQGQASKCCRYLNPEYFSFHHMTYYDMHYALRQYRSPCPQSGRKP